MVPAQLAQQLTGAGQDACLTACRPRVVIGCAPQAGTAVQHRLADRAVEFPSVAPSGERLPAPACLLPARQLPQLTAPACGSAPALLACLPPLLKPWQTETTKQGVPPLSCTTCAWSSLGSWAVAILAEGQCPTLPFRLAHPLYTLPLCTRSDQQASPPCVHGRQPVPLCRCVGRATGKRWRRDRVSRSEPSARSKAVQPLALLPPARHLPAADGHRLPVPPPCAGGVQGDAGAGGGPVAAVRQAGCAAGRVLPREECLCAGAHLCAAPGGPGERAGASGRAEREESWVCVISLHARVLAQGWPGRCRLPLPPCGFKQGRSQGCTFSCACRPRTTAGCWRWCTTLPTTAPAWSSWTRATSPVTAPPGLRLLPSDCVHSACLACVCLGADEPSASGCFCSLGKGCRIQGTVRPCPTRLQPARSRRSSCPTCCLSACTAAGQALTWAPTRAR